MQESLSNYLVNNLIDQVFRQQPGIVAPVNIYVALIVANEGVQATGMVYPAASYMTVLTSDGTFHLYYSSAGGTSAGSAPTFPGIPGESVVDGTVTWVEQTAGLKAGTAITEPTIGSGSYTRVPILSGLAAWAGTQGAGTTTPSTGTSGTTSNNSAITYASPTGDWAASPAVVWGVALYDAASAGNLLAFGPVTSPQSVPNGSPAPSFVSGAATFFLG